MEIDAERQPKERDPHHPVEDLAKASGISPYKRILDVDIEAFVHREADSLFVPNE